VLKQPLPAEHSPSRATICVVDPEPLYRWFVTESLSGCGVDVLGAASLEEAAAYLRTSANVDLLIVDGDLLHTDGARLRLLRERTALNLLVLDSDGDLSRLGLDDATVVAKPVDSTVVAALVDRLLGRDVSAC
jgi:DNA-binding response OmpR family regulator